MEKFKQLSESHDINDLKDEILNHLTSELLDLLKVAKPAEVLLNNESRLELLSSIERYVKDNISDAITIKEVANLFDVSERTLLYTFKSRYGVGLKHFVKVLRAKCSPSFPSSK